jgi:hypothetical protein
LITGDESWFFIDNSEDLVWVDESSSPPEKCRKTVASPKVMLIVFFSGEKIIYRSYLSPGRTMKSENFITTVLEPLLLRIHHPDMYDAFPEEILQSTTRSSVAIPSTTSRGNFFTKPPLMPMKTDSPYLPLPPPLLPLFTYESCHHPGGPTPPSPPSPLLHFDNAPAHRSGKTKGFLKKEKVGVLSAPPYSPDLAPSDFFLFGFLKQQLKGTVYKTLDDLKNAIDDLLYNIPSMLLRAAFDDWQRRCREVMKDGEYHEH